MHSTRLGWPPSRYIESGYSWVVGSHFIQYLRPAFEDEQLGIITWVSELHSRMLRRQYWCVNKKTGKILAKAETQWVFVNGKSGKPCRIVDELRKDYIVVVNEEEVREFLQNMLKLSPENDDANPSNEE